jgi:galactokinase
MSTAETVQHLGHNIEAFHEEFRAHDAFEINSRVHTTTALEAIQSRLESVEVAANAAAKAEDIADALAAKAEDVADALAAQTERVARELHTENMKNMNAILSGQKGMVSAIKKGKR